MKVSLPATNGLVLILFILSACSPSEAQVATAIAQTETAKPILTFTPEPTATQTPEPTPTLTPTPEPTATPALPDIVQQTYADIELLERQDFGDLSGLASYSPLGWNADGEKLYTTSDYVLEINGRNSVAFYADQSIREGEAVILRFEFAPRSIFSIGIDSMRHGTRVAAFEPGFLSICMEFRNGPLALFNAERNRSSTPFEGDLKLLPGVWYMYTLGFAPGKQFVIKIWDPKQPENVLVHRKQADAMRDENLFIMWVDPQSTLYIDDFTRIRFSGLK